MTSSQKSVCFLSKDATAMTHNTDAILATVPILSYLASVNPSSNSIPYPIVNIRTILDAENAIQDSESMLKETVSLVFLAA